MFDRVAPLADRLFGGEAVIRSAVIGLTLLTAAVHYSLGGLLFTLNAAGYLTLAAAMAAPIALGDRYRWLPRLGLLGYTATTILAWLVMGPYFPLAFFAKGVEVALIALLLLDIVVAEGTPRVIASRVRGAISGRRRTETAAA